MLDRVSGRREYRRAKKRLARRLSSSDWARLNGDRRLRSARFKLDGLRTERAEGVLRPLYSRSGRRARDPSTLIRSFVLMLHLGYTSIQRWVDAARADALLQYLVGEAAVPAASTHYDFLNRVTGDHPHLGDLWPARKNTREVKAEIRAQGRELPKRHDKLENWDDGDVHDLKLRYWDDASCDARRWTLPLERLLDELVVRPSCRRYRSQMARDLTLSSDGSALHIHSNKYGHRVEDPADDAHTHRYTAPDADIGWDSDLIVFYLGFSFYNISWHSRDLGIDLPMFVTLRAASQHDALTTVSATAHMLDVNPSLRPAYFCHDSAADAAHLFHWMRHRGVVPIIDWNPRHADSKNPYRGIRVNGGPRDEQGNPLEHLDDDGVPVCACGMRITRDGYDRTKMATKYRCPLATGKIAECPFWGKCTESPYGRVVKTYDKTSYKLFGPVPYRSERWKDIYRDRTSTERVNNRVLNDYKVHSLTCRDGAKHLFLIVMACVNVHLDAWTREAG